MVFSANALALRGVRRQHVTSTMAKEFVSLLPSFMGKYDLAWKVLRKLEGQLKAVGAHKQTIGYPALEAKLVDKLEPLSYEITLTGYDEFASSVVNVQKKLDSCLDFTTSAEDALGTTWAVEEEIPKLLQQAHKMADKCRNRVIFYFVAGVLIVLFGLTWFARWALNI